MKNSILTYCLFSLTILGLSLDSCRKPEKPKDPCKNPVTLTALPEDQHYLGHFKQENNNTVTYYHANNYGQYASQITAGREYQIGFKEGDCYFHTDKEEEEARILPGGCVVDQRCMDIKCLKEVPRDCITDCHTTIVNALDHDDQINQQMEEVSITGNTLNAKVYYSGCSPEDPTNFTLYVRKVMERCPPSGDEIFYAKAADMRDGFVCQAYFGKTTCFDLTPIKTFYTSQNLALPEKVTIRYPDGQGTKDIIYMLK